MKPRVIQTALIVLTLLYGGTSFAAPGLAKVDGARILVGDIINQCEGVACEIEIGPSPLPGHSRVVRRAEILGALKREGVDSDTMNVPKRRRVTRPMITVPSHEIKDRVRQAVAKISPEDAVLKSLGDISPVNVPRSGFQVVANWPGEPVFQSRVSIPVSFVADGEIFRTAQVFAEFRLEMKVPVASVDLKRGSILREDSFTWTTIYADNGQKNVKRYAENIIGCRVVRPIFKGQPFLSRDIEELPVVKRGQKLLIQSNVGLVSIKANGIARQDAKTGERIRASVGPMSRLLWVEITGPGRAVVTQ